MRLETRGARREERLAISELVSLAFGEQLCHPGHVGWSQDDPHDRPENTRILLADGEIISVVHIGERHAYALEHEVPIGFLTAVCTHPEHRGRGYLHRVMADADEYMRRRGFCYGVLFGAFKVYCGKLGWRPSWEKVKRFDATYAIPTSGISGADLTVRPATSEDVPFLEQAYRSHYKNCFGPVVRSEEYWRRWSLTHHWEGQYVVALREHEYVGYFHADDDGASCDEIAWRGEAEGSQEQTLLAAASWAAGLGKGTLSLWVDKASIALLRRLFGAVEHTWHNPVGWEIADNDATPWLPENWPDGFGYLVKFFNPGPGILADVDSTDALTDAMEQYSWTTLDGDWM